MSRGLWVFVCGPSGAGKDSVLAWAAAALAHDARFVFTRRLVTRERSPGSDHDEVTPAAFERLKAAGRLAWDWQAHGHHYGIAGHYAQDVAAGRTVVVNGSREHAMALAVQDKLRTVLVTAQAERVAARLYQRGRESVEAVAARIARNAALDLPHADAVIANDGDLDQAGQALQRYLLGLQR